ncbi:MAG: sigma 54-interacting transcriptional regulator [Desulfatitalea sp.]|nr:sigma 54-interacting transcriptional regulator [Desulfatitalea sp.]NNK00656.1 sigma 54-interacting transcriptional regulator [Desulfatitalea sp.]
MSIFANIYIIISSVCIAVSLLHLLIFLRRREQRVHLIFSIMALCAGISTLCDLTMFASQTTEAVARWLKLTNNVQGLLWISFVWFIDAYTRQRRRRLALLVTGLYSLAILVNMLSPYGVLLLSIDRIETVTLFWGEQIHQPVGQANPLRIMADAAWLILLAYALISTIRLSRQGEKRRAWFFGISVFACLGVGYLSGTLVDFHILPAPSLWNVTFLALIILMSSALADEVVRASILSEETVRQEQRWRCLMDTIKMVVVGLSPDGRVHYANAHFYEITGFAANQVIGKSMSEFIPSAEQSEFLQRFATAMSGEGFQPISFRGLMTSTGERREIRWANALLDGVNSGTLSIGEDVTDILAAEKALADEKARMDVVLSSLDTGLALIDADLNVLWVNEMIRHALPFGDPVGKKCYLFAENRETPCIDCGALKAIADGQTHETIRYNDKAQRWYQIISIPIKDEYDKVVQILEGTTDITLRKQTEDHRDQVMAELEKLKVQLEEENLYLKTELSGSNGNTEFIGHSNAILYIQERIRQVAQTDATVLIQGETGVGKELVARAVYRSGNRSDKPYIRVNCAALSPSLVESELFGHEVGAFTGADRLKKGRFELADKGTLLLDEISELSIELQAKLLRVLQERQFERVGSAETRHVDVRVIATTNRNLQEEIEQGSFRADLYYRLQVYPITVPPLRKRKEDIEALVMHFLSEINTRVGKQVNRIPHQVMARLTEYDYPGNVRELKNLLENAVITSIDDTLRLPRHFSESSGPTCVGNPAAVHPSKNGGLESLDEIQREHIQKVLEHVGGRIEGPEGAAAILDLKPSTLRHRIQKLGINRKRNESDTTR